jgi:hypothetical protein
LIPDDPGLPGYVSETLLLSYAWEKFVLT